MGKEGHRSRKRRKRSRGACSPAGRFCLWYFFWWVAVGVFFGFLLLLLAVIDPV
jgi:hypothetical protein